MEPAAAGHSEKTFSYIIRAPSSDGFDVMNVDVKIDTSWIFQDAEDSDEEQGHLPEAAAGRSVDVDTGVLRKQLESSEQKLLAAVDKYVSSESGLRSRIQELELSERRLLRKVDQLRARVCRERSACLRAQEQLEVLQGELASQVREERAARRQRWRLRRLREQLRYKDEALGQQTAALERCRRTQRRQLGLAREQERVLREQVRRLERDVRRLCRAAGLLLAELDASAPGSPRPTGPQGDPEEAAERCARQARAECSERETDEAARRQREQRATERSLRWQLEELRCCIFELKLSEIGLQGQVEDLTEQNRCLREELGAQAPGETVRSAPSAGHCSLDAPGHVQDEWLSLPWEAALEACRSPDRQASPQRGGAPEPGASADQPAKGPRTWGSAGAGCGPSVSVPGLETPAGLLGDPAGPGCGQAAPAAASLHEQALLLIGGCFPAGPCAAGPLLPAELAWTPEPFLLLQAPTLPPGGPAGDAAALLPQGAAPGQLQIQQVPDARLSLPAPRAVGHPCRQHHEARSCGAPLCEESSPISHHRCPGTGRRDLKDLWQEGGAAPEWGTEEWAAQRTWGRTEEDLGARCQRRQESHGKLSVEGGAGGLGNPRSPPRAAAPCLWPGWEPPPQLLQGVVPMFTEGPKSPSGGREVEEQVWGLLGGLSSEEEDGAPPAASFRVPGAKGPSPTGPWLLTEEDRGIWSCRESHLWPGDALLLLGEGPAEGGRGEEAASDLAGPRLGCAQVPGQPGSEEWEAKEVLFFVEEGGLPLFPRWALSPEGVEPTGPPRAPCKEHGRSVLTIDAFAEEMEVCFQQLPVLKLGTGGRGWEASMLEGEDRGFAGRWHSGQEHADPRQAPTSQGLDTCPAKEADSKESHGVVKSGGTEALGTGQVLPGRGPDLEDLCLGLEGSPEPGQGPSPGCEPSGAQERAWTSLCQLISGLRKERSHILHDNVKLQRDQERCYQKIRALQTERERNVSKISKLEQENGVLLGDIRHLRRELDQYLQVISDLEDCNMKSYSKISELEEENEKLRGWLGRLRRATSERARRCEGVVRDVTQENRELKALISELGVGYKELIEDVVVGVEDTIRALRGENVHLLRRIRVLEREVAAGLSTDVGRFGGAQGKRKAAVDKADAVERAVQATQLSEQLAPGAQGPPLGGGQGNGGGAGVSEAHSEEEEERPRRPEDQGPALRSPCSGPQLQEPEAAAAEEDLGLRVRQLRHQVRTLQCQLRDQGSAGRELQAARDEALRLRDQLQAEVEELQKKQHEANLAVTPLKAKLASLVQKCRDRNHLLVRLLQELRQLGAADPLLSETVRSAVNDVALAEYAAAFLAPGLLETGYHLDVQPEKTAAARAQKYLLNPEMDSALLRPLHPESWRLTEAEWPAQTARPDSLELPPLSGPTPDGGPRPAAATVAAGLPAQCLQEEGGVSCSAVPADTLSPPPELRSPARILAFHRELRQSILSSSRAHKSPLEL
ncbi:uncharacterized protein C4orf50 homolog [Pteronotus mesoamericanus]|uniref:uncharacterized protein C4orf50 homolog n=1 Tax=Pteronotus mesoamericanus TaxID=1884717 RepID=UPI0023ECC9AB|nr:uncharacterized protein C4orf50 homolog [Pteronotus parnellii mesoamericanus]